MTARRSAVFQENLRTAIVEAMLSSGMIHPTQPRPIDEGGRLRSRCSGALRAGCLPAWAAASRELVGLLASAEIGIAMTDKESSIAPVFMRKNCAETQHLSTVLRVFRR